MAKAPRAAADGFEQGWGSSGGRRVLNSTGLVKAGDTYAVTLLSSWSQDVDWATVSAALTRAARDLRSTMH